MPLVGERAAGAATYLKMLCQAIVNGVIKQKVMDASLTVDTVKMDKGQLSSFAIGICSDLRRGRISVQHGGCSSVIRENGVKRPVGKWPSDWADGEHDEDGGDDRYGVRPQQGVEAFKEGMYGLVCRNTIWKAWDDVTSASLMPRMSEPLGISRCSILSDFEFTTESTDRRPGSPEAS